MKVKPKEAMLNIPIVLLFNNADEIPELASNANVFIHGKVKIRYEELGSLNGQFVAIFYIQRNDEYHEIRSEFVRLIEEDEIRLHDLLPAVKPTDNTVELPHDHHDHEDWEYGPSHSKDPKET
jgi:hypothetical protein